MPQLISYEQLPIVLQMSYSTARASANESWARFMGRRKIIACRAGEPDVSVLAGRGHRSPRGAVTFKSALQLSGSPQRLGELWLDRLPVVWSSMKKFRKR
ncbi:hypothetical protein ACLB1O_09280 [Escherichia coli]